MFPRTLRRIAVLSSCAAAGVPVRIITEPERYRNRDNVYQASNLDRMYAAGVKIRERAHLGFLHEKTTMLYAQGRTITGSSNWTTASDATQYEHNYFATDATVFGWFHQIFTRKWTSTAETRAFVPLPPDTPINVAPLNASSAQSVSPTLSWKPGPWAHGADVYLGTTPDPPRWTSITFSPGTSTRKIVISGLTAGTTYYWTIVSKTAAGKRATGPIWSFATANP